MASYSLSIARSAERELEALPPSCARRVIRAILGLAKGPRPPGCEKLTETGDYRIRVGQYRVVYTVDDGTRAVTIIRVAHRSKVYRHLK